MLLIPFGLAVQGPYALNGKEYYVVNGADPNEDTGNEVCAKVGKTCVGYTAFSNDICKQVHPDAKTLTSVHGSKAGFYCNGPPQKGLACESTFNTCEVCPACNVNADCNTAVGDQFREMYVECSASNAGADSACPVKPTAKNTKSFLDEIPSLSDKFKQCPTKLNSAVSKLVGNGWVQVIIKMKDGSEQQLGVQLNNGQISSMQKGSVQSAYTVRTDEEAVDLLLNTENKFGVFSTLYNAKRITISANSFFKKIKLFFAKPILGGVAKKNIIDLSTIQVKTIDIGPYPDKWACEFYQLPWPGSNEKKVTCEAYKAGDSFCVTVLQSPHAKAEICDPSGVVVCSNPCDAIPVQVIPASCPFDRLRERGTQAPPLNWCKPKAANTQSSGKSPANCMDTYLAGHDAYSDPKAKELWDSYSAKTKKVCQVLQGQPSGDCVYSVQTAKRGVSQPYYLCWYN